MLRAVASVALLLPLGGCAHNLAALRRPPESYAVATAPPFASLVYAARAGDAVIVIDLGWYGARGGLRRALREIGAEPREVTDVFLTHSHRDHVGAWPLVRQARFHLAAPEAGLFESRGAHQDLPSRGGELLFGEVGPWPGEVDVRPFAGDSAFVFGADTVRAFVLPGHTAGSAAYLFRGILFVGDAFAWNRLTGLRRPAPIFSADRRQSRGALRDVLARAGESRLEWICNAHAKCFRADSSFVARLRQ